MQDRVQLCDRDSWQETFCLHHPFLSQADKTKRDWLILHQSMVLTYRHAHPCNTRLESIAISFVQGYLLDGVFEALRPFN